MNDVKACENQIAEAREAHKKTSERRQKAKQELRQAKAKAAKAAGQKLPEAEQTRIEANSAQLLYMQAEKDHKNAVLALNNAIQEEKYAKENKEEEDRLKEILNRYDLILGYESEQIGLGYNDKSGSVFFDCVENGEVMGSFQTRSRTEIENIVATLTTMLEKMS